ncbi:putative alcohol-forming fatty acyl-CoA reductase [Rosa chinensis]|uniref:Putative alcohol-forming fatty acyl-CoA reductase n=2 Tax=Rosa chinensis TaxID=74649 RepID=A0A2P6PFE9_ROSCH|nr:putative alcohol-forming fatty acyl-CoA reductase [Rosa chinensis]
MDPTSVLDMIPVDMLVNSIITAIVMNGNKSSGIIYHVGTSLRNPINMSEMMNFLFQYCTTNPLLHKDGSPIKIDRLKMFKTMDTFRFYMQIRFMLPLEVVKLLNKEFDQYFRDVYVSHNRKLTSVMRLAELYEPYLLFKAIFDDTNSEELRRMASKKYTDAEIFNFDPKCINWEDYVMRTHIPGLWKNVMTKKSHSRL